MNMTTELAGELLAMTDDELLDELTRPDSDIEYKTYINSIALIRILEALQERPRRSFWRWLVRG